MDTPVGNPEAIGIEAEEDDDVSDQLLARLDAPPRQLATSPCEGESEPTRRRPVIERVAEALTIGYHALTPEVIERASLRRRRARGLPARVPGYLIAKLALDVTGQGQRLGSQLLDLALQRAASAAVSVGGRFVLVDAIDGEAASFCGRHGFEDVPGHPGRLLIAVKDLELGL